jgi:hypothetical protein
MPQIPVNYVLNCDCEGGGTEAFAITEAVETTAAVVAGALIDYYLFLTSRPYPLESIEGLDIGAGILRGLFLEAYVEAIGSGADMVSGSLRNALVATEMADEAIDAAADLLDGSLRVAYQATEMADEAIDTAADLLEGALRPVLVETTMADEAVDVSAALIGGSLT